MTINQENVRSLATQALDKIGKVQRHHVYASRKGVVAAVRMSRFFLAFRRVAGVVRLEKWPLAGDNKNLDKKMFYLPPEIQQRAAFMLDNL